MIPLIPIIAAALPLLPGLIRAAEGIFSKRSPEEKRGPSKREYVIESVLDALEAVGILPAVLRNESIKKAIGVIIDRIVGAINGELKREA